MFFKKLVVSGSDIYGSANYECANKKNTVNIPVSKLMPSDPLSQVAESRIKQINIMQHTGIKPLMFVFLMYVIIPTLFWAVISNLKGEAAVVTFACISHRCNISIQECYSCMVCEVSCQTRVFNFENAWLFFFFCKI